MAGIRIFKTSDAAFEPFLRKVLARRETREGEIASRVGDIIDTVRRDGDAAVLRYSRLFDNVRLRAADLEVTPKEIDAAIESIPAKDLSALRLAAKRITAFHKRQLLKSWSYRDPLGMRLGQRITPIGRVGVYVPGGKASYPSTVLMNAVPARVAGVREIIMTSPVRENNAIILAAARIAGVDRIFRIGGAQAIAALAF